ncbi:glycoside hydrolase family 15 protein [Rickenella mellea]|uniref:Glucoamylase n=1 Tax=Rickenella mellea TaxID=50990 RepID=A0A4Y7Q4G1_9AGAM|nr:glycoside hydrolase family 15 protein [Rickenella mellea]
MHLLPIGLQLLALALLSLQSQYPFDRGTCNVSVDVDKYIRFERRVATAAIVANIGPQGAKARGVKAGVVVASPSKHEPDYFYSWTRDSSLVFKLLIDQHALYNDAILRQHIDNFIGAQAVIQNLASPSGGLFTGGLGEPKFNVDLTAFHGPWGRPQRDGPALRSTAMITYANWLIDNKNITHVQSTLWPLIKLDLDYVATNWNQTSFDLWEEVSSSSFFTAVVQHRALREGANLASKLQRVSYNYGKPADNILCFMQSFWNPSGPYMTANTGGDRSGIDLNTVLASIHTYDIAAGCDAITFQPCSDRAIANLFAYVKAFDMYKINDGVEDYFSTGRYPEDVYYGGNPWYLATFAVAEQLYDSLHVWNTEGFLQITPLSLPFFRQFDPTADPGCHFNTSRKFVTLTSRILEYADSYLLLAARYTPQDGALAEQYDRDTGTPVGARDLTWSYAAALTAFNARDGTGGKSWGAKGLIVPDVCRRGGGPSVKVSFNVFAKTVHGENIYITGSSTELTNWNPEDALILSPEYYPTWSITIDLPANSDIEYKYIRKHKGNVAWQSGLNNRMTTHTGGNATRSDTWWRSEF